MSHWVESQIYLNGKRLPWPRKVLVEQTLEDKLAVSKETMRECWHIWKKLGYYPEPTCGKIDPTFVGPAYHRLEIRCSSSLWD